mgnify:CR=1 FL=1
MFGLMLVHLRNISEMAIYGRPEWLLPPSISLSICPMNVRLCLFVNGLEKVLKR